MKVAIVVCCVLAVSALCDGAELRSFLGSTAGGPTATFPLTTICSDYSAYFNGTYSVESFSIVNNTVAKISVVSAGPNPFKVYLVRGIFTGGFDSNATSCTRLTMLDRQVFYSAQNALETAIYLTRGFYSLVITGTPIEAIVGTTGPVFTTAAVTPLTTGAYPANETTSSVADTTASADMSTTDGSGTTVHADMSSGAAVTTVHADTTGAGSTTGAGAVTTVHADMSSAGAVTTVHADTTVAGSTTGAGAVTTVHADTTVAGSTSGASAVTTVHADTTVAGGTSGAGAVTTVHADTTVAGGTSGIAATTVPPKLQFTKRSSMVGDAIYGIVEGPGFYYGGRIYLADGVSTINDNYRWDRPSYPEFLDCEVDAEPSQNDTYVPFDLSYLDSSTDYDLRTVIVSISDYHSTAFNGQLVGSTYYPSTTDQFFSTSTKAKRSCDTGAPFYARLAFGRTSMTTEANETVISAEFLQYNIPSPAVIIVWPMERRATDSIVAYFAEPTIVLSSSGNGFEYPTNITYNSSGVNQCSEAEDSEDLLYFQTALTITRNTSTPYTPIVSFATEGGFSWDIQASDDDTNTLAKVSTVYLYNDAENDRPDYYSPCLGFLRTVNLVDTTSIALVNSTYNYTFQAVFIGNNGSGYFAYQVFVGSDPEVIPNTTDTGDITTGSTSLSGDATTSTGQVVLTTDSTTVSPSTGIQTTDVQTTGVQTTDIQTTDVQTTGEQNNSTTGVMTTATARVSTTGDFNIPASVRIIFRIRDIEAWNANLTASRALFLRYTAINMEADNSDNHLSIKSIIYGNNRKRAVQDATIEVGIAPSANARSPSEQAQLYVNKVSTNPSAVDYGTLGTPVGASVVSNAPTPSPSQQGDAPASRKLSGGAIAGIVIGCVVFVAILVALGVFLYRRRPESQGYSNNGASLPTRGNPYYKDVPMTGV